MEQYLFHGLRIVQKQFVQVDIILLQVKNGIFASHEDGIRYPHPDFLQLRVCGIEAVMLQNIPQPGISIEFDFLQVDFRLAVVNLEPPVSVCSPEPACFLPDGFCLCALLLHLDGLLCLALVRCQSLRSGKGIPLFPGIIFILFGYTGIGGTRSQGFLQRKLHSRFPGMISKGKFPLDIPVGICYTCDRIIVG